MKGYKHIVNGILVCGSIVASVSVASETEFTRLGSIKAGNSDGSIPAYNGGMTTAPPDFKANSGFWENPFKDEKPLYRITDKNITEHAEKLSQGQLHLLRTVPDYYIDIYPTHRTASFPEEILQATERNNGSCKTVENFLAIDVGCRGGLPFPRPENGYEVMWNQLLTYPGKTAITARSNRSWLVIRTGIATNMADQETYTEKPYYQVDLSDRDPELLLRTYSISKAPVRRAGEATGIVDYINPVADPREAWQYVPGLRRIKKAPEFSYDTPVSSLGGGLLFDELFLFSGKMDRFDFKFVGTKEMYIPYNNYDLYSPTSKCNTDTQFLNATINPSCERFELHRVRIIEATRKGDARHVYSRRMYYLDEDLSGAGMSDAFDNSGELHHSTFNTMIQLYDNNIPWAVRSHTYDFSKGSLTVLGDAYKDGWFVENAAYKNIKMSPDTITSRSSSR